METIVAALIAAGASLLVCLVSNHYQAEKIQTLLQFRMDILERKQDTYNNVIARVYKLEQDTAVQEEKISALSDAVDELKS